MFHEIGYRAALAATTGPVSSAALAGTLFTTTAVRHWPMPNRDTGSG